MGAGVARRRTLHPETMRTGTGLPDAAYFGAAIIRVIRKVKLAFARNTKWRGGMHIKLNRMAMAVLCFPLILGNAPNTAIVPATGVLDGRVNDAAAHIQVSPAGFDNPTLSPEFVTRAHISTDFLGHMVGLVAMVGNTAIKGKTGIARLLFADASDKRRIVWFERAIAPGYDGLVGPGALSAPRVTFILAPTQPGERAIKVPMATHEYAEGVDLDLGGQRVFAIWDPRRPVTLATAATAQALAGGFGGSLHGSAQPVPVNFGLTRPARTMHLTRPLKVPGGNVSDVLVRVNDFGSAANIPDADADANEIVVSAGGKKAKPRFWLTLGQDALRGCSSIMFDRGNRTVTLMCR